MPKLKCKCGYVHNLSPIPDDGWTVIKSKDYEDLLQAESLRDKLSSAMEGSDEFNRLLEADKSVCKMTSLLYECPECKNLMWEKPGEDLFTSYEKCN